MTANSKIEWTDHTFNPWWGCVKVSEGCKFCYAEGLSKRYGNDVFGVDKDRRFFSHKHWQEPYKWDRVAGTEGKRARVFCSSMADVFEDNDSLIEYRQRLWDVIESTNNLDWLLLTKRPENVLRMIPQRWLERDGSVFPENIWMGTSVENQARADFRIPRLLDIPARIHFLSVEPMLEKVDLDIEGRNYGISHPTWEQRIEWVICGGESGAHCRPFDVEWAYDLRDQCKESNTPFFMKQLGGHPYKRDRMEDFPENLRIRDFPELAVKP